MKARFQILLDTLLTEKAGGVRNHILPAAQNLARHLEIVFPPF